MFSLESGQPVEVATDCGWLSGGCQVELTALKALPGPSYAVEAIPWWSLSFEAFGDPEAMQDGLDRVAGDLLREPPPVKLSRESSYSYPVWLQGLH